MKQTLLTITTLILTCFISHAQANSVPPLINYQGMLTDANGTGLAGVKKLEFNLYDSATSGNKVWGPQIFSNVPLMNGMFNVILGTTDTEGRSVADAFGSGERYLGIRVGDGQEIAPRQQILSAPFAIQAVKAEYASQASQAENASQADVAETVRGSHLYVDPDNGNVGIGTTEPEAELDVNGSLKSDCRICIGWADDSGGSPQSEVCVPMIPNSESPLLGFNGDVNGDDRIWLFFRCP